MSLEREEEEEEEEEEKGACKEEERKLNTICPVTQDNHHKIHQKMSFWDLFSVAKLSITRILCPKIIRL
jgi:hypothetical protein